MSSLSNHESRLQLNAPQSHLNLLNTPCFRNAFADRVPEEQAFSQIGITGLDCCIIKVCFSCCTCFTKYLCEMMKENIAIHSLVNDVDEVPAPRSFRFDPRPLTTYTKSETKLNR